MAQTSLLESFDPFATHPFTNNSCAPPALPPHAHTHAPGTNALCAPRPRRRVQTKSTKSEPVFVPFEQDRSVTPDLDDILIKKSARPVWKP